MEKQMNTTQSIENAEQVAGRDIVNNFYVVHISIDVSAVIVFSERQKKIRLLRLK